MRKRLAYWVYVVASLIGISTGPLLGLGLVCFVISIATKNPTGIAATMAVIGIFSALGALVIYGLFCCVAGLIVVTPGDGSDAI